MDRHGFDALARSLAAPGSRRGLLAAAASLLGLGQGADLDAKRKQKASKKKGKGCKPKPRDVVCAGRCGPTGNTCGKWVDCGPCGGCAADSGDDGKACAADGGGDGVCAGGVCEPCGGAG
jgi:hypothetical protein